MPAHFDSGAFDIFIGICVVTRRNFPTIHGNNRRDVEYDYV